MPIRCSLSAVVLAATLVLQVGPALAQSKPIPIKKIAVIACPEPTESVASTGAGGASGLLMGGLIGPNRRRTEIADDGFGYEQGRVFRSGYAFGSAYKFAASARQGGVAGERRAAGRGRGSQDQ
jgi:hypothetical protein